MKSNKNITILSLLLIGLVAVILGRSWWSNRIQQSNSFSERLALTTESISGLVLENQDKKVQLNKKDSAWLLNDSLEADAEKVNQIVTKITNVAGAEEIAQTSSNHDKFGVTPDKATKLTLSSSSGEKVLLLGEQEGSGTYVRFADSDTVYVIDSLPSDIATLDPYIWANKTIIAVEENQIKTIDISDVKGKTNLTRGEDNIWQKTGKNIDSETIKPLLNTLQSFLAQKMISDEDAKTYPQKATKTVVITPKEVDATTLTFFEGKEDVLVKSDKQKGNFVITSSVFDNFSVK